MGAAEHGGWQVHLERGDVRNWMNGTVEITVYRNNSSMGFDQWLQPWVEDDVRAARIKTLPAGTTAEPGVILPAEVLPQLRDLIEPGPTEAERQLLTDALAIERARVDKLVDAAVHGPEPIDVELDTNGPDIMHLLILAAAGLTAAAARLDEQGYVVPAETTNALRALADAQFAPPTRDDAHG